MKAEYTAVGHPFYMPTIVCNSDEQCQTLVVFDFIFRVSTTFFLFSFVGRKRAGKTIEETIIKTIDCPSTESFKIVISVGNSNKELQLFINVLCQSVGLPFGIIRASEAVDDLLPPVLR